MENNIDNLDEIVSLLNEGKIILYPTDTGWEIGCDAMNEESIKKIYSIKNTIPQKPYILLVADMEMLKSHIKDIHPRVETLLSYHSRPLTVVYKAKKTILPILLENSKVAIRIVQEPKISELISKLDKPIASTSASIHNENFPNNFDDIPFEIKTSVDYIFYYKRNLKDIGEPPVLASFAKSGKLKFLK